METMNTTANVIVTNTENTEKENNMNMEQELNITATNENSIEDVLENSAEKDIENNPSENFDFDNLERYSKHSVPWSVKQMVASMNKGTAKFDNTVQRSLVWTKEKKSRLIHTVILNLPCPPLYANVYKDKETGKKIYDFLDGKQRSHAFKEFLEDKFELVDVPVLTFTDGKEFDLNGYKFSELPEELKDMIKDYSLSIFVLEELDEDEVADLFYILNNGVSLTKIEISRVKANSLDSIHKVSNHPLFDVCLTEKAKAKYYNEDIVVKAFALLFNETDSLENKDIRPYMETMELTEEDINGMNNLLNIMYDIYNTEIAKGTPEAKKVARKITTRTHFIALIPFIYRGYKEDRTLDQMVEWVETFFNTGTRATTVSEYYNDACRSNANGSQNVHIRNREIEISYEGFFFGKSEEEYLEEHHYQ